MVTRPFFQGGKSSSSSGGIMPSSSTHIMLTKCLGYLAIVVMTVVASSSEMPFFTKRSIISLISPSG